MMQTDEVQTLSSARGSRFLDGVLIALFFLSGFSALIYQVVWQRLLGLVVGVDVYAVSVIVATFMVGLGAGSYLGGLVADRVERKWLVVIFASAELAVALVGFFSKSIFYDWLGSLATVDSGSTKFIASIFALLVPTFCMGLSLPLLTKAIVSDSKSIGRKIACLYGVNTLGAAFGAFFSTIILIRLVGIIGALNTAAILNLITALGCFAVFANSNRHNVIDSLPSDQVALQAKFSTFAFMFFLSGFTALALELLWFQLLGVLLKSNSFTFSWLLTFYLGGLGVGSLVGAYSVERSRNSFRTFLALQSAIVLYSALSVIVLVVAIQNELLPKMVMDYLGFYDPMSSAKLLHLDSTAVFLYFVISGALIIPPTFAMGLSFPYFQKAVQTDVQALGSRVGFLQLMNILGATVGTIVIGLIALNFIGASGCLKMVTLVGAIFVFYLCHQCSSKLSAGKRGLTFAFCAALIAAIVVALPSTNVLWATLHASDPKKIILSEAATGLTLLKAEDGFDNSVGVYVNGLGQSFLPFGDVKMKIHSQLGMLPVFIHKNPVDVGIIGLGSGDTLFGAGGRPETKSITCIELIKTEHSALQILDQRRQDKALRRIFEDPRITYQFTDGRQFIGSKTKLYDVLEADALRPRSAYSNNVFSVEYFTLLKNHLKPGGIAVSWIPTERVRQTFASVFTHNVRCGDLVIGSNAPIEIDLQQLRRRSQNSFSKHYYGLANIDAQAMLLDIASSPQIIASDPEYVAKAGLNTDLFPRDEFFSPGSE